MKYLINIFSFILLLNISNLIAQNSDIKNNGVKYMIENRIESLNEDIVYKKPNHSLTTNQKKLLRDLYYQEFKIEKTAIEEGAEMDDLDGIKIMFEQRVESVLTKKQIAALKSYEFQNSFESLSDNN